MAPIAGEDAVDTHTLRIRLKAPYAPLLSLLANRPGTPLSPRILSKTPDEIAAHPVCAGPFAFKERVAQDHILLERFQGYWNADAVTLDRILFRIVPDSTVRRVNLQAGALDIVDKLAPSDMAQVQADPKLRVLTGPSIGFQPLALNLGNGPGADNPFGRDARVREAFEKSIDREAINQVVFDGKFVPSNQTEAPGSRYWDPARPVPPRDLEGAKRLLKDAGLTRVPITFVTNNDPVNVQIGEIIQVMAGEAGFDVKVVSLDSAGAGDLTRNGMYQVSMQIWSGRPEPDGNISYWVGCNGSVNRTGYCNPAVDALLTKGAQTLDPDQRVPIYRQLTETWMKDRPYIVLFHFTWIWGLSAKVDGFAPRADGIARPVGISLRN
jgi:peptide/nickel transport system substrate-binding protein